MFMRLKLDKNKRGSNMYPLWSIIFLTVFFQSYLYMLATNWFRNSYHFDWRVHQQISFNNCLSTFAILLNISLMCPTLVLEQTVVLQMWPSWGSFEYVCNVVWLPFPWLVPNHCKFVSITDKARFAWLKSLINSPRLKCTLPFMNLRNCILK